jgi:citrate synthase
MLYPAGDPRTAPLLDLARSSPNKRARTLVALADAAAAREFYPSVDVGLAALVAALGLAPTVGSGLFAVARSAGWLAHVLEQRTQSYVLRPRARYVGVTTP